MRLSVLIHTYYRYECLDILLDMLTKQTIRPFEVVISDQTPCADRPPGFYEKFLSLPLVLINLDKPSHGPAQNLGAKASKGDVLLFIDDDMEFGPDFLEQHLRVMRDENADVVVGATSETRTLPGARERAWATMDPISFFLKNPGTKWHGMCLVTHGGNTLFKKDVFLAVGGYDEKMPRMTDIELGYRMFRYGAKIHFSEKPFAYHKRWKSGGTRGKKRDMEYVRWVARIYIHKKHFPGWTTQQFILHEVLCALFFRKQMSGEFQPRNLLRPYLPVVRLWKIGRAYREAAQLLKS